MTRKEKKSANIVAFTAIILIVFAVVMVVKRYIDYIIMSAFIVQGAKASADFALGLNMRVGLVRLDNRSDYETPRVFLLLTAILMMMFATYWIYVKCL